MHRQLSSFFLSCDYSFALFLFFFANDFLCFVLSPVMRVQRMFSRERKQSKDVSETQASSLRKESCDGNSSSTGDNTGEFFTVPPRKDLSASAITSSVVSENSQLDATLVSCLNEMQSNPRDLKVQARGCKRMLALQSLTPEDVSDFASMGGISTVLGYNDCSL